MSAAPRKAVALAVALASLTACTLEGRVPEARVALGPASSHRPRRVVARTSSPAGSVVGAEPGELERVARAVDARVRMDLEMLGWTVIDGESIRGVVRERVEATTKTEASFAAAGAPPSASAQRTTTVDTAPAPDLATLPALDREAILDALAVDTIVDVTLQSAAQRGATLREPTLEQAIAVVIAVTARPARGGDATVLTSACSADAGAYASLGEAADRASRCAVAGITTALATASPQGRTR